MRVWDIGIVGGGPGGLLSAYFLQREANDPFRATLFEASDRLGGKILTPSFRTVPASYEAGAAEIYDYSHLHEDPLKELIVEDLALPISHMEGASAVVNGRPLANLDDLGDQFGPAAVAAMRAFDHAAKDAITPGEFYEANTEGIPDPLVRPGFDRLLNTIPVPAVRAYVQQFIHSDLATEPPRTSVAYGLHNYVMNDPAYMSLYGVAGGNERIVTELAKRMSADVRLGRRAVAVGRASDGRPTVTTDGAGGRAESTFDALVLALPNVALARLTCTNERLAGAMAAHLADYDHPAHYLRVTVAFREKFWDGLLHDSYCMLEAFGGCCLYDESSRQPGGRFPVLGWLLGGADAEALDAKTDDELVALALASLPPYLAHGRELVIEARVHRWVAEVNALPGGLHARTLDQRHRPEPVEHPFLFVVGDYLLDSTLNGVLDSADYVARWLSSLMADAAGVRP